MWLSVIGLVLSAQAPVAAPGQVSSLEGYINGIMESAVIDQEIVGATVALVADGRLVMARGYGHADLQNRLPVQARSTAFRIGSITKVLVWMSVLQQVESGRLDLGADVNDYLRQFKMASEFTEPITLRHLMTHTAGLEDSLLKLFVGGPRQMGNLADNLAERVPRRTHLPGTLTGYSNYGAALAAHLVANVSGQGWDRYVEDHLLHPMRMSNASTLQPLPRALADNRARGYAKQPGGFAEKAFTYIPLGPAGGASATALDMAKLMLELLNPASTGVLSAESKALLLNGAYIVDPAVNGMTLGMYQQTRGGSRAVGHDGSTVLFHSRMILWPDENVGLFVSVNTNTGAGVVHRLSNTLSTRLGFDRWDLPGPDAKLTPIENGEQLVGTYLSNRRNESNFTKMFAWVDTVGVRYDRQAELIEVEDVFGLRRYRQLKQNVFQEVNGPGRLVFARSGTTPVVYVSERPMVAYTRVADEATLGATLVVVLAWGVLALGVLIFWPVSSLSRAFGERARGGAGGGLLFWLVMAGIGLVVGFAMRVLSLIADQTEFVLRGMNQVENSLWLIAGFAAVVLVQVVYLYRVWVRGIWWPARRIHFTLLVVAQVGLVWWFWYWKLLPPAVLQVLS